MPKIAPPLATLAAAFTLACTGASVPADATPQVRAALEACGGLAADEKQECYEERLLARLDEAGVAPALEMLGAIGAADVAVQRDGHVYTHAIGIEAYSPDRPVTDVFGQCTTLYQSGCYHGVIQAHFLAEGDTDAETVQELCEPYHSDADRWILFQCLHGLGHGLTMYHDHHLPRALGDCDSLESSWDRESCYGGAFMENVVNATSPHHPASEMAGHDHGATAADEELEPFEPLRTDDPHYPCSVLEDRYQTACYMMQTSVMLWHNNGDVADAAESCSEAPERVRRTCFQSLGRDISSRTLQDHDDSLAECRESPEEYREWCYVGLVKNFIDLTATTDDAFAFCAKVEEWARPRCHEAIGEEIGILHGTVADRRGACAVAETFELQQSCLRGARVPTG